MGKDIKYSPKRRILCIELEITKNFQSRHPSSKNIKCQVCSQSER